MSNARNKLGWLGSCGTPYCGRVDGYFCEKCRHYVTYCRCGANTGGCTCRGEDYGKHWVSSLEYKDEVNMADTTGGLNS